MFKVGAGAVGAFYGARLHQPLNKASKETLVSVVCRSNYNIVNKKGFEIESPVYGSSVWKPHRVFNSCTQAAASGIQFDYIVVTTKALPEVRDDSVDISPVVTGISAIVLIQNGFGIEWPYRDRYPQSPIISCVTLVSCTQTKPGLIVHSRWARIYMGPFYTKNNPTQQPPLALQTETTSNMTTLVDLFKQGGVDEAYMMDAIEIQLTRWHKLAINATFSPTSILGGGVGIASLLPDPTINEHARECMREVFEAGPKLFGRPFPSHLASIDSILENTKKNVGFKPSMLVDWEEKRPLELEVILGNPLNLAKLHGVEMPRIQTLYALLKSAYAQRKSAHSKL
ncbi:hypothetical protein BDEG_20086 [Batrachochytrium dendrobatidis JEL423]|uniref:2-dehydropantoate 2-reductase n=1 Tax=Batrachochytrium dendrobatidis (strain JEL423) TaxID=403673 RepID=A0A177W728_BATDL|nr:hypothetical protein BDEG_20086 [Batrachochytrium dendrobatidis JEL423]